MKKIVIVNVVGFLWAMLLWVQYPALAQEVLKSRVNKSFKVDSKNSLELNNSFGKVHVNTHAKNNLDIEAELILTGKNQKSLEEVASKIEISIEQKGSVIKAFSNLPSKQLKGITYEINFTVSSPEYLPLTINNRFGDLYIGDHSGEKTIDLSYGQLKLAKMNGKNDIKLSFGGGSIEKLERGKLHVRYSNLSIGDMDDINLITQFSDVDFTEVNHLTLESKYGSLKMGRIGKGGVSGSVSFSGFTLKDLEGDLSLTTSYPTTMSIENIHAGVALIDIQNGFGTVDLGFTKDFSGALEASFRFSDLSYKEKDVSMEHVHKADFSSSYKGKINGQAGSGNSQVKITSKYGDVKLSVR